MFSTTFENVVRRVRTSTIQRRRRFASTTSRVCRRGRLTAARWSKSRVRTPHGFSRPLSVIASAAGVFFFFVRGRRAFVPPLPVFVFVLWLFEKIVRSVTGVRRRRVFAARHRWRHTVYYDRNTNSVPIWTFPPACSPAAPCTCGCGTKERRTCTCLLCSW